MRHVCRLHPVALSALCALRHDNTQICNCNWLCGWCCCCCQCCFFVSLLISSAHTLLQIFKYMLQWENKNREKNNANALKAQLQRRKKRKKKEIIFPTALHRLLQLLTVKETLVEYRDTSLLQLKHQCVHNFHCLITFFRAQLVLESCISCLKYEIDMQGAALISFPPALPLPLM